MRVSRHRQSAYVYKPKLKMRPKARPAGMTFNIEVRLMPCYSLVEAQRRSIRLGPKLTEDAQELDDFLEYVKPMIGRSKVIKKTSRGKLHVRILLDRDADVILLAMVNSKLIYRIYNYI